MCAYTAASPLVFLVSTKRAFYLIGVPVGSGVGCKEGTAEVPRKAAARAAARAEKWGPVKASAWL